MTVLDDVERLLAKEVYCFDEEMARQLTLRQKDGENITAGELRVGWEIVPIKIATNCDPIFGTTKVDLKESHCLASLRSLTISGIDCESLVLKPDNCGFRFYNRGTYNKACDYLILTRHNGVRYAFFVDLKSKVYEKQDDPDNRFLYRKTKDEEIVWQMIGANTILDSLISVLEKKTNKCYARITSRKKRSNTSELIHFKRRYVVLYQGVDETGEKEVVNTSAPQVNEKILDSPIYALNVSNKSNISLGWLVSSCPEGL